MKLRRSFLLFSPAIIVLVVVFVLTRADQGAATPEVQHPASTGQVSELRDLVQRDQRIRFEARVTGARHDVAEYEARSKTGMS